MCRLIAVALLLCLLAGMGVANAEPVLGRDSIAVSYLGNPRPSRWCGWWLRQQLGIFLGFVLAFFLSSSAKAHDWYPPVCCSGGDCGPVDGSRITRDGVDYVIDHRWRVQRSSTQPSPDGRFHGCWPDKDKPPVCVFAPPDGM